MDRGSWWATVHRVAKSRTVLKRLSTHACLHMIKFSYENEKQAPFLAHPSIRLDSLYLLCVLKQCLLLTGTTTGWRWGWRLESALLPEAVLLLLEIALSCLKWLVQQLSKCSRVPVLLSNRCSMLKGQMHFRYDSFLQEFTIWEVKTNLHEMETRQDWNATEQSVNFHWNLEDGDELRAGIIQTLASIPEPTVWPEIVRNAVLGTIPNLIHQMWGTC